jgi:hypothetical protein
MENEKRLIDANALKAEFPTLGNFANDLWLSGAVRMAIDNAPTVDAVEVVRGRCVYVRDDELIDHWECSVCGRYIPWEYHLD